MKHAHSPSTESHRRSSPKQVACAVVTISDTRTLETDESGKLAREILEKAGHRVVFYRIVRDEARQIEALLDDLAADPKVEAILTNGGTGISPRDTTFEVVARRIERPLPGFGELFRMLSYEEIGAAAMLSRAQAGISRGKALFATPGSTAAVRLALERLIAPELGHVVGEIRKGTEKSHEH